MLRIKIKDVVSGRQEIPLAIYYLPPAILKIRLKRMLRVEI
jgi:hypothetical protein